MKINTRHIFLSLLFTLIVLPLSQQAMAVNWQTLVHWATSGGLRNIYLMVNVPSQRVISNHITHLVATNLNPVPALPIPANLQFHFFPLQGGHAQPPLSAAQLQAAVHSPEISVTLNTHNCQTTIHTEHDSSDPLNPSLHTDEATTYAPGLPNLILANYLLPGCMLHTRLSGPLPPVHNTLSVFHSLLGQPARPLSQRTLAISQEQLSYSGPVVPRNFRRGLLGSETPEMLTLHPFTPLGGESAITAQTPGVQVFRNRYGVGRIFSTNALFAAQGIVMITVDNQHIIVASNGQGDLIALVPVLLAASWHWLPREFNRFSYKRDSDDPDRPGGSGSGSTLVR